MAKRTYQQAARRETAEDTRRRIVEATFDLHRERGIAATSMKQIAARAGVSVGAVYHHFPTYDDAIQACGQLVLEKLPPLDASIFDGLQAWPERVRRLAAAQFAQYDLAPVLEAARADRHVSPKLEEFLDREERHRKALAAAALEPLPPDDSRTRALAALIDIGVWRAFTAMGFGAAEAADLVTQMFSGSLHTAAAA